MLVGGSAYSGFPGLPLAELPQATTATPLVLLPFKAPSSSQPKIICEYYSAYGA